MRHAFTHPVPSSRTAIAGLLLLAVAATSGCGWARKSNQLYAQAPQSRPLEVPPDLDRPRSDSVVSTPALASAVATAAPPRPAGGTAIGFTTTGTRDEVYAKVDAALIGMAGVQVASRAIALGVFDVNYQGANFLVRVSEMGAGAYVAALDPRGLPATGDAPTQLIAALRSSIVGN